MGMDLEGALPVQLARSTSVLFTVTSQRVYPVIAKQGAILPYIVTQKISDIPVHASGSDPEIHECRFQVTSYGQTYASAKSVAKKVEAELRDFTGMLGHGTSGVVIQRIFFDNETDMPSIDPETQEATHGIAQDYLIWATT